MEWLDFEYQLLLKFIGISAILMLFYYILYAKRASYLQCRVYLLSIIILSAVISTTQIKIYPSEIRVVEQQKESSSVTESHIVTEPVVDEVITTDSYYNPQKPPQIEARTPFSTKDIILIIYFTVIALLVTRYIYQMYKIFDITRWGSITFEKGVKLVRNNRVSSPFSYFKNIYINRKLEGETLNVVLQHETCHIEHRHYIDALLIESLSILMWFNPLIWIIKRELRDIHEFQVDSSLIKNGLEVSKYQNIIFAELMGYSPEIANGFHNSLIKKRFIMMNKERTIKYNRLRKLSILPLVVLLLALFSFTTKDEIVRYTEIPVAEPVIVSNMLDSVSLRDTLNNSIGAATLNIIKDIDLDKVPYNVIDNFNKSVTKSIDKLTEDVKRHTGSDSLNKPKEISLPRNITNKKTITSEDHFFINNSQNKSSNNRTNYVDLRADQIVVSNRTVKNQNSNATKIKYIEQKDNKTLVTTVNYVWYDRQWINFSSEIVLIDCATGEEYKISRLSRDMPFNKNLVIVGQKGKCVEFTMEFPALKSSVTCVDLIERPAKGNVLPANASTTNNWKWTNLELSEYKPVNYNYNVLKEYQMPTVNLAPNTRDIKLLSVVRNDTATLVTYATQIYFDSQWIHFGSGWVIRDCKTHEKYYIKSVQRDIPLNRVSLIQGKKGKFVMYTMVFPRIDNRIEKIDIMKVPYAYDVPIPSNSQKTCWFGVYVKNNKFYPDDNNTISNDRFTHPAQMLVTEISSKGKPKMELKISNKRSTFLNVSLPEGTLFSIPRDFAIRDTESGKLFKVKSVRSLGLAIKNTNNEIISSGYTFGVNYGSGKEKILLEFENLTYGVDKIDIGVFTKDGEVEHPWSYKNLEINN